MVVDWGWVLELRDRLLGLRLEDLESSLLLKIGGTVKIERERFIEDVGETSKLAPRVLGNECGERERRPACHSPDHQSLHSLFDHGDARYEDNCLFCHSIQDYRSTGKLLLMPAPDADYPGLL